MIKSSGESTQLCKTPTLVLNQSEISPLTLTVLNLYTYRKFYIPSGPKKTECFWGQITLQRLMIERRVICQKFCLEWSAYLYVSAIKYSLPNLHKSIPQNCIELVNDTWVLLNFYSKISKARTISNNMVSPDEIQHEFKAWVSAERMLNGRKDFSQSKTYGFVAVSK